jgi:hypothetical protein
MQKNTFLVDTLFGVGWMPGLKNIFILLFRPRQPSVIQKIEMGLRVVILILREKVAKSMG